MYNLFRRVSFSNFAVRVYYIGTRKRPRHNITSIKWSAEIGRQDVNEWVHLRVVR